MPHLERGAVVELLHLLRHGLGDPRMAVAERAAPQAREAVEQALALGGRVVRALGAREHSRARIPLQIPVGSKRHPVRAGAEARGLDERFGFGLHGSCSFALLWGQLTLPRGSRGWRPPTGSEPEEEGGNPMLDNLVIIFNFIISQWSLSPQAFKDAVLFAALAKCVLAVLWWTMRMLVTKFPASEAATGLEVLLNNRGAKLLVLVLDVTLIDVFLFFACV